MRYVFIIIRVLPHPPSPRPYQIRFYQHGAASGPSRRNLREMARSVQSKRRCRRLPAGERGRLAITISRHGNRRRQHFRRNDSPLARVYPNGGGDTDNPSPYSGDAFLDRTKRRTFLHDPFPRWENHHHRDGGRVGRRKRGRGRWTRIPSK